MPTSKIARKPVESHQLRSYGYDAESKTLAVTFRQGKDGAATSRPYEYPCTPEMFAELEAAESKGGFFNASIKGNPAMPHSKIVETDEERAERKQAEGQPA